MITIRGKNFNIASDNPIEVKKQNYGIRILSPAFEWAEKIKESEYGTYRALQDDRNI